MDNDFRGWILSPHSSCYDACERQKGEPLPSRTDIHNPPPFKLESLILCLRATEHRRAATRGDAASSHPVRGTSKGNRLPQDISRWEIESDAGLMVLCPSGIGMQPIEW